MVEYDFVQAIMQVWRVSSRQQKDETTSPHNSDGIFDISLSEP